MVHKFHLIDVSLSVPPVFLPIFGFSEITAPELNIQYKEIKEGNFEYPRKVFDRATVNNITLRRGAILQDSDYWEWTDNYLRGNREKKNLVLIQSTNISARLSSEGFLGVPQVSELLNVAGRAWVLRNCSPGRYKAAGDFNATESAISIMELDVVYEFFVEFNLAN